MLIGHHFGKRKPQWNFFIRSYEAFKYGWSFRLIKLLSVGLAAQVVILSPVVYWIYQNYSIIEASMPTKLNLHENIQFEKKWIAFLILGTFCAQTIFNFFLWKNFLKSSSLLSSEKPVLHVEADYQHRAS